MRLKVICCEIFFREVCRLAAACPHRCDVEFLPKGLHDLGVERMRPRLQERIDAVEAGRYDAVLLGYGLCNNGVIGLACKHTRLVIPRAHDCITLFLGSRQAYREYFDAHPGTYFWTSGWAERNDSTSAGEPTVSQKLGLNVRFEELVKQYGEDNARYIMETMGNQVVNYRRLAYIRVGLECDAAFRAAAEEEARRRGWAFEEVQGTLDLLRRFLWGEWDDDFLVVEPGHSVDPSYDEGVLRTRSEVRPPVGDGGAVSADRR